MNQKAPSKLLQCRTDTHHTHTHNTHAHTHLCIHTPVVFHAVHNTEGIQRGLCNKEHTKQFIYGCGMNSSTHMHNNENTHTHKHTHRLFRSIKKVTVSMKGLYGKMFTDWTIWSGYITVRLKFLVVTSHDGSFSLCSHQLGPPTWSRLNCLLRYPPSQRGQEQATASSLLLWVCACINVCVSPETMNSCIVSWWPIMHAVCISGGKCTSSLSSGEQREFAITAPPCASMCAFVTVRKWVIKWNT